MFLQEKKFNTIKIPAGTIAGIAAISEGFPPEIKNSSFNMERALMFTHVFKSKKFAILYDPSGSNFINPLYVGSVEKSPPANNDPSESGCTSNTVSPAVKIFPGE